MKNIIFGLGLTISLIIVESAFAQSSEKSTGQAPEYVATNLSLYDFIQNGFKVVQVLQSSGQYDTETVYFLQGGTTLARCTDDFYGVEGDLYACGVLIDSNKLPSDSAASH